jgi:ubiquinone/menaquinone biosynthesis C-methylase UbiE
LLDSPPTSRLHAQHLLIEQLYHSGALLHPDVHASLSTDAQILDAGTGTGVWALELASRLPPTVTFTCTDISTRLFPKTSPANVMFTQASTLDPLPQEWTARFDLIHQRLMMVAFRVPEWKECISNFYAALKPGGILLLMEAGATDYGPPESATARAWGVANEMMITRGVYYDQPGRLLPQWLEEAGFMDIHVETHYVDLSGAGENSADAEANRTNIRRLLSAMSGKLEGVQGLSWKGTATEYEALVDEADEEYARTPGLRVPWKWFTARKPM